MIDPPATADRSRAPKTTSLLALAIVALVAATEAAIFIVPLPATAAAVLQVIVGVLIGKFGTVYDFYFGSSKLPPERDTPQ